MSSAKGIVLMCAPGGRVVEVLHDDFGRARRGEMLTELVDPADREKCALFVGSIAQESATFGWEMHVGGELIVFVGFVAIGPWIIVASEESALMERLHQDLMGINNELTNGLRSVYKQRARDESRPDVLLDEFARLNNELSALHRDHAKRAQELERINRDFERRQEEMADLEKRRQEFVQHLVHDLRNPLTSVRGGISLALMGALGPIEAGVREALVLAREGCERITGMIDNLLDLGRAEAGQLELTRAPLRVAEAVEDVLRELRNRAAERSVALRSDVEGDAWFLGERSVVHRVLGNYVGNALKFSPAGAAVDVVARAVGDRVRVSVVDRGPGITAEVRARLFTRYGQGARHESSTGLGLVFCKEMVQVMGGAVGVESVAGQGATFWFELERAADPEPAA